MLRRSFCKLVATLVPCVAIAFAGLTTASAFAQNKPADKPKDKPADKPQDKPKDEKKGEKDIVETLAGNKDFSTLSDLIKAAGLDSELKGGTYTIFAPTNAAFDKVGKDTIADWKKPENKTKLAGVLKMHVASGKKMKGDLKKDTTINTLNGDVKVTEKDGTWMFGTAKITATDTAAKNGVIHTIDTVQMPAADKPVK